MRVRLFTDGRLWLRRIGRCRRSEVLCLVLIAGMTGCLSSRGQRAAECHKLCDQAKLAREQGRSERAEELLDAAVRSRPADRDSRWAVADELFSSGRQLAAAELMEELAAEYPDDGRLALRLAEMQLEIGRTDAALAACETALRSEPCCPQALALQAVLEQRQGEWDAALATYNRLIQADPDNVSAQIGLAVLHLRLGQPERAAPMLRQASQHPAATQAQRSEADWQLGLAYSQQQRWYDAARLLEQGLAGRTMSPEDWYRLGFAESRAGRMEEALVHANQALADDPQHVGALTLSRQLQQSSGQFATAVLPAGFSAKSGDGAAPVWR